MVAVDSLKSESEPGKTSEGAVAWRGRGMRCIASWLFVEVVVVKWSVRPQVGAF